MVPMLSYGAVGRIEYILRDQSGFAPRSLDHESLVALLVWAWEALILE
jgi:hypothetical protein